MKKIFLLLLSAAFVAIIFSAAIPSTVEARGKIPKLNTGNAKTAVVRGGAYGASHAHGVSAGSRAQGSSGSWRNVPGGSAGRRNINVFKPKIASSKLLSLKLIKLASQEETSFLTVQKRLEQMFPPIPQEELEYRIALDRAFKGDYDSSPDSLLVLVCEAERRGQSSLADKLAKRITNLDSLTVAGIACNVPRHSELKEKLRKKSYSLIENAYYSRISSGDRLDYIPDSLDSCVPYVCDMVLVDRYVPHIRPLAKIAWSPELVAAVDIFAEAADSIFAHGDDFDPVLQRSVFANLYNLYLLNRRYDEAQNLRDSSFDCLEKRDSVEANGLMNDMINIYHINNNRFYDDPSDLSWPEWVIEHSDNPAYAALVYINSLQRGAFDHLTAWDLPDCKAFTGEQKNVYNVLFVLVRKGLECAGVKEAAPNPGLNEDALASMLRESAGCTFYLEETLCLLQARDRSRLASAIAGLQDIAKRISTNSDRNFADRRCINAVHQAYLTLHLTGEEEDALKVLKKNRKLLKQPNVTDSAKEFYYECMAQLYDRLGKPGEAKKLRMFKADHTTLDDYFFNRNLSEMNVSPDFKRW